MSVRIRSLGHLLERGLLGQLLIISYHNCYIAAAIMAWHGQVSAYQGIWPTFGRCDGGMTVVFIKYIIFIMQ